MTLWDFLTNVYVFVVLRTISCGLFQKKYVLVVFPTFWCGHFLKMSIFWMIWQQFYVDISWKCLCFGWFADILIHCMDIFWKCVYFLMIWWHYDVGIFSKSIHFGCCGSVLMRIFCIIWQNYSDPNKKVDWVVRSEVHLSAQKFRLRRGKPQEIGLFDALLVQRRLVWGKSKAQMCPNLPIYAAAGRPGARFPPGHSSSDNNSSILAPERKGARVVTLQSSTPL